MKKINRALLYLVVLIAVLWGIWLAKCEALTFMYVDEFENGYQLTGMLPKPDVVKVLKYGKSEATVYYVKKHEVGATVNLIKENNEWKLKSWGDRAWSSDGSAESAVMPYFWHLITMR